MAGVALLSGSPGVQAPGISFTGVDKVGHIVVYGLLAVAWVRWLRLRRPAAGAGLWAIFLTLAFGGIDESIQATNPHRFFEWADLLADGVGAVAGTYFYSRSRVLRTLLEWRIPFKEDLRRSGEGDTF
jgi:VanZ family protein